jgi:hypothetical protein
MRYQFGKWTHHDGSPVDLENPQGEITIGAGADYEDQRTDTEREADEQAAAARAGLLEDDVTDDERRAAWDRMVQAVDEAKSDADKDAAMQEYATATGQHVDPRDVTPGEGNPNADRPAQ